MSEVEAYAEDFRAFRERLERELLARLQRGSDAEDRLAEALFHVEDLLGYLDWCNGLIPARPPKESNVRAFAHKIRTALERRSGD